MAKQNIDVRVSGVTQDGTAATAAITSDPIEFKDNAPWSLNIWYTGLTGTAPLITIEVSNTTDTASFTPLRRATALTTPRMIKSELSKWRYFRVVLTTAGTTGGFKFFDLIIEK